MIVSWNELQRTCRKAFRGLRLPAGVDEESSFAVLWLQARGLDALAPLDAALASLERMPPRPLVPGWREGGMEVLDAGGQPALSVASGALDLAVARAVERAVRTEVLLAATGGGAVVAGALPQRPIPGRRARVQWREADTRWGLDVSADGARRLCATSAQGPPCRREVRRDSVLIVIDEPGEGRWIALDTSWRIVADDAQLERRAMDSVMRGIEVPGPLWTRLLTFAGRTLVPATAASREAGAGGGEYND